MTMATPKAGCLVNIREKHLETVRAFYPKASKDTSYVVEMVDRSPTVGRARVYVAAGGGERWCLWFSQVKAHPRCGVCDKEGHTTSKHPGATDAVS